MSTMTRDSTRWRDGASRSALVASRNYGTHTAPMKSENRPEQAVAKPGLALVGGVYSVRARSGLGLPALGGFGGAQGEGFELAGELS